MKNSKEYIWAMYLGWNSHNVRGKEVEELLNSDGSLVYV
jgi:hypothetical protein